jgi:hypothetical protein
VEAYGFAASKFGEIIERIVHRDNLFGEFCVVKNLSKNDFLNGCKKRVPVKIFGLKYSHISIGEKFN